MESSSQDKLVLWYSPLRTLHYFFCEIAISIIGLLKWLRWNLSSRRATFSILSVIIVVFLIWNIILLDDPDGARVLIKVSIKKTVWYLYWIGLGVLSSIGLGSGLHTFILYLGPHIAKVTLAAYECSSLQFPEPPYPDDIICPENSTNYEMETSLLDIMFKVQMESIMWGFGTAIGELPPYLIARMKRLSGTPIEEIESTDSKTKDEDFNSTESNSPSSRTTIARLQDILQNFICRTESFVQRFVRRVGFIGIMFCASIPNPLFDLVGITCGHYLVPFSTFFAATVIGKALIKIHIQQFLVIMAFSDKQTETLLKIIRNLPFIGEYLGETCRELILNQKARLRGKIVTEPNLIASLIELFVLLMIAYFIISIVNSLAQKYHSRLVLEKSKSKKINKLCPHLCVPVDMSANKKRKSKSEKNNNYSEHHAQQKKI